LVAESLENQKKGLMQKIFSQELRFKDDDGKEFPAWEEKKLGEVGVLKNGIAKGKEFFGTGKKFINLQDVFGKTKLLAPHIIQCLETLNISSNTSFVGALSQAIPFLYLSPLAIRNEPRLKRSISYGASAIVRSKYLSGKDFIYSKQSQL
jgi:hypothetical protein